jgi:ketosteroid isomerase-like protein
MSQENVEIVRRVQDAFDAKDMDALVAMHHPDVELVVLRSEIEGPYRGHEGLRRMATEAFEADWKVRVDEIRDCGDRVLVLGRQGGTVRGVPPLDHVLAEVYEIESRKVARMQAFPTVAQALAAVGLSEDPTRRL